MFHMPDTITYALPEQIGNTELFVGRKKEFDFFLGDWNTFLKQNMAQSQALLARRKKGKTAFLQRLFNILWSDANGNVIPFYYAVQDQKVELSDFSKDFFTTFANHYISFLERKPELVTNPLSFDQLEGPLQPHPEVLAKYHSIQNFKQGEEWGLMWKTASRAPFHIAASKGFKIVQIFDEFQNIDGYVYDYRGELIDSMSGAYLDLAEKKEAPLIVSGSEVHGLIRIIRRLTDRFIENTLENLPEDEACEAINMYANFSGTHIDQTSIQRIWNLTRGDPLYIKALFFSRFNSSKDYTNVENIVHTYELETTRGEIFKTWMEYILKVFHEVNQVNAKRIMLYLFQAGEERTRAQILKDLKLDMSDSDLESKLQQLVRADLVSQGQTAFDYRVSPDKTYELVFRQRYQKEIDHFVPDIRAEIKRQMGRTSVEKGKFREFLLKEKLKKSFNLQDITENGPNQRIKPLGIAERKTVQLGLLQREIDLVIEAKPEVWVDVKDTQRKYGKAEADRWIQIMQAAQKEGKDIVFLVYSQSGFTQGTRERLLEHGAHIVC
ncbi:MAG TPA: hypothetical protein PLF96_09405 [Thermotogota bacterium]|nr:hypothetical protein [Thermotogota bacterium]